MAQKNVINEKKLHLEMTSTLPFNNDLSTWSQELYLFLSSVWT